MSAPLTSKQITDAELLEWVEGMISCLDMAGIARAKGDEHIEPTYLAALKARLQAETTVPTPLEYNVGEEGWMSCDHCDSEVVEALKCTGCGATSIARPAPKARAEPELRHDSPQIQFSDVFDELEKGHPVNTQDAIDALWWKVRNQRHTLSKMHDDVNAFKNLHRLLCERFGYVHDPKDWRRDQLSLIEHIASQVKTEGSRS